MNNEKFIMKWEKNRQKGKFKYIMITCITSILAGLVGSFIGILVKEGDIFNSLTGGYSSTYIGAFIGSFIGAGIGSLAKWSSNEEKYNNLIVKNSEFQYKEF